MDAVLREIHFAPDRRKIRQELMEHMEDRMEEYEDEERVLQSMGNPAELGRELNREHKPWLGWLWIGSWAALAVTACCALLLFAVMGVSALADRPDNLELEEKYAAKIKHYDPDYNQTGDVYYNWQTDYTVEVLDTEITFRNFVYDDFDGRLVVYVTSEGAYSMGSNSIEILIDGVKPHSSEHYSGQGEDENKVGLYVLTWERFDRDAQDIAVSYNKFGEGFSFGMNLTSGEVRP